jgi:hypothetical protein
VLERNVTDHELGVTLHGSILGVVGDANSTGIVVSPNISPADAPTCGVPVTVGSAWSGLVTGE